MFLRQARVVVMMSVMLCISVGLRGVSGSVTVVLLFGVSCVVVIVDVVVVVAVASVVGVSVVIAVGCGNKIAASCDVTW